MKTKHTQGEWKLINQNFTQRGKYSERFLIETEKETICAIKGQYYTTDKGVAFDECEANAHLISAAPEMLVALKGIIPHLQKDYNNTRDKITEIELAIAKAEGK